MNASSDRTRPASSSLIAEAHPLAALEALASGTPVIAFRAGAFPQIVEPARTGFLVSTVAEMADALREVDALDPNECRRAAEERFSAARMVGRYLDLYQRLAYGGGGLDRAPVLAEAGAGRPE